MMHPAELRQILGQQAQELAAAREAVRQQGAALRDLERRLQERADADRTLQKPRFIEDVPGPRMPYTYVASARFTAGDAIGTSVVAPVTIAADGPFVCTDIAVFWRPTHASSGFRNEWLPPTRIGWRVNSLAAAAPPTGTMEFSMRFTTGGSGRWWQSDWLPGAMFDRTAGNRPHYVGISGWVERTNTLSSEARAEMAVPQSNTGEVWTFWSGYQILIPINLSEQFGWAV